MMGEVQLKEAKGEQTTIDRCYNNQRYTLAQEEAGTKDNTTKINLYNKSTIKLVLCQLRYLRPIKYQGRDLHSLADLQQMSIRIPEETANLSTPIDRRSQKNSPARLERLISSQAVRHANSQLVSN